MSVKDLTPEQIASLEQDRTPIQTLCSCLYCHSLRSRGEHLETEVFPPPLYPVLCMDCQQKCGQTTVPNSTGLCSICLHKREIRR